MAEKKFLDSDGLATLVGKIKGELAKKQNAGSYQPAGNYATLVDGKVPLSQLGNIDTTFVEVLTDISKLPTTNIGKHIYLIPDVNASDQTQNRYAEYVYTGALPINDSNKYDGNKWEKLGDFQAEVDLTGCVGKIAVAASTNTVNINANNSKGTNISTASIPAASTSAAGVMTASDKNILNKLAARYPLQIASLSVSPSVYELGTSIQPTVSWSYSNEDFHTVGVQTLKSTDTNIFPSIGMDDGKLRTKQSGAAYTVPTQATQKTDTITLITGSLSKSVNIIGVHASYCGKVAASKTSLTADEISKLGNKAVLNGKGRTVSISQSNEKLVYAYPAYFGDLSSIKDGNGFQGFSGYTKLAAVTVNGASYNVYMQNTPATATGSYTFA